MNELAKQLGLKDARGMQGRMARGNNVYNAGAANSQTTTGGRSASGIDPRFLAFIEGRGGAGVGGPPASQAPFIPNLKDPSISAQSADASRQMAMGSLPSVAQRLAKMGAVGGGGGVGKGPSALQAAAQRMMMDRR